MIIQRSLISRVFEALVDSPLVLVEGCPRSGRTVFARQLTRASTSRALYLDARNLSAFQLPAGAALAGPAPTASIRAGAALAGAADQAPESAAILAPFLAACAGGIHSGALLVIDNADEAPGIAEAARILAADETAEAAASAAALRSAAGLPASALRIVLIGSYFAPAGPAAQGQNPAVPLPECRFRLHGFSLAEAGPASLSRHWLRGSYPEAFLAPNDEAAFALLEDLASRLADSSLMRALPSPATARRLLRILAEVQGQPLRQSAIAASLGVSRPALARCIAALEGAGIIFFLPAWSGGPCARPRLSPLLYFADQGLCHSLLGIASSELLTSGQDSGRFWEAYAVGEARKVLPPSIAAAQYRTQDGASLELILCCTAEGPDAELGLRPAVDSAAPLSALTQTAPSRSEAALPRLAASIRSPDAIRPCRGAVEAALCLKPAGSFLVVPEASPAMCVFRKDLPDAAEGGNRTALPAFMRIGLARFLEAVSGLHSSAGIL